jgi:copper transport protein
VRWSGRALILLLTILGWLSLPTLVSAHAVVVRSEPSGVCVSVAASVPLPGDSRCVLDGTEDIPLSQSPIAVRLWFSEPVEPFGTGLWVVGPSGERVDRGPVRQSVTALGVDVDATKPGTYLVHWQIVAADTHPGRGSYRFVVGQPGGVLAAVDEAADRPDTTAVAPIGFALEVAARWLHFLGYALAFGVLAIRVLAFRPNVAMAGGEAEAISKRLWLLINLGIALLIIAEPIALLGQTGSLGAGAVFNPDLVSAALDSSFGRAMALRLGVPFLLWLLVGIVREGAVWAEGAGLGLGLGLGLLDGASAHARSVEPLWLGLSLNALHLAAMGAWLGGLIAIAAIARRHSASGPLLRYFGRVALGGLAITSLTGLSLAASHLAGLPDLTGTTYGIALAGKTALLGLIVIVVGTRRRKLGSLGSSGKVAEIVGIALVLVVAGILVSLPPPV